MNDFRRQQGMSLIELMVGLVIALVLSLVMFNTLLYAEGQRRTTSSGNDAQQAGSIGTYQLERFLRMAGSGVDQAPQFRGCALYAVYGGTQALPLPTLPPPFDGLNTLTGGILRGAPLLIANGGTPNNNNATDPTPDTLIMMAGTHPSIDTWFQTNATGAATSVSVLNSVGLQPSDYLVGTQAGSSRCDVVQADPATTVIDTTPTSPTYRQTMLAGGHQINLGSNSSANGLAGYVNGSQLADIGTSPLFTIFAVSAAGTSAQLSAYNMLTDFVGGAPAPKSLIDGVVNLQALYGLATVANPNVVSTWVAPTGNYSLASLNNGSAASIANIGLIRAVRIGMITRSAMMEKTPPAVPATIKIFPDKNMSDLGLTVTVTHTGNDLYYRYRYFDFIVALRNH